MKKRKISRVITSIYTSNTLLLALATFSIDGIADLNKAWATGGIGASEPSKVLQRQEEFEKITVKSHNKNLLFLIAGKPGRHCAVAFKLGNMKRYYIVTCTKTVIGPKGIATMMVDMSDILDRKVLFSVMTSESENLDKGLRAVRPFEIQMSSKQITEIRGLQGTTNKSVAASMGSAGQTFQAIATLGGSQ
jgi:hypothetical protein